MEDIIRVVKYVKQTQVDHTKRRVALMNRILQETRHRGKNHTITYDHLRDRQASKNRERGEISQTVSFPSAPKMIPRSSTSHEVASRLGNTLVCEKNTLQYSIGYARPVTFRTVTSAIRHFRMTTHSLNSLRAGEPSTYNQEPRRCRFFEVRIVHRHLLAGSN